jgi:two-component system chemotaxis sensor kinase CheA
MESSKNRDVLQSFIEESKESLEKIGNAFIRLENDPANMAIIDEIFRPIHSLKGNSGFFDLTNINKFSHKIENLIDFIRKDQLAVDKEIIDVLLTGVDYLQKMLDRAAEGSGAAELKPEEETFITSRVDTIQPSTLAGSIQSVFDLRNLLDEALDLEIDIDENALVSKVLGQIEKANHELRGLIEAQRVHRLESVLSPDAIYRYEGADCSQMVKPLGEVMERLRQKKRIGEGLLKAYFDTLISLQEVMAGREGTKKIFKTLKSMSNFFDDQMLVDSDEFYNDLNRLMGELVACFQVEEKPISEVKPVGQILIEQKKITEIELSDALGSQKKIGEILVQKGMVDPNDVKEALMIQGRQILSKVASSSAGGELKKTIRIDQDKLDDFANAVGELFINLDSFAFLKKQLDGKNIDFEIASRFASAVSSMDDRVSKLQENIMDIRKVPVGRLFQRFPKIVRQLSNSLEKDIHFVMTGEDTVIDKDLIEKIENPLVHMLRNAVDHGIENPDARLKKGKPLQGRIELAARVDDYYVHLSIRDDGGGIDPRKMKEIALKNHFITENDASRLSDQELVNLIFKPGFSSADQVSDVSGRGVGMDVVLSSLNKCNGAVDVNSVKDQGTTVRIKIPLTKTLVTKDALIVESSGQLFAIPSDEITTTLFADIHFGSILSQEKILSYNNAAHHVVCLNSFFYAITKSSFEKKADQVLIVCSKYKSALLVDKMFNHQKIVFKTFSKSLKQFGTIPGISGYTLLGNEDIVLVVDIEDVIKRNAR